VENTSKKHKIFPSLKKYLNFKQLFSKKENVSRKKEVVEKRGFDVISAQIIVIFMLVISILLTNVFWENSAINVFIRNMFSKNQEVALKYTDFAPTFSMNDVTVSLTDGVITANGEGTVYSPLGGEVEEVSLLEDGTYKMTIKHTDSFKTILEGISYPYYEVGSTVYSTCPVGYSNKTLIAKMYNNNVLITNYVLENGNVIWE